MIVRWGFVNQLRELQTMAGRHRDAAHCGVFVEPAYQTTHHEGGNYLVYQRALLIQRGPPQSATLLTIQVKCGHHLDHYSGITWIIIWTSLGSFFQLDFVGRVLGALGHVSPPVRRPQRSTALP